MVDGPTINVGLGQPDSAKPLMDNVSALIDTGASDCVMSSELAASLNLPFVTDGDLKRAGVVATGSIPLHAGRLFLRSRNAAFSVTLPFIGVMHINPPHEFIIGCKGLRAASLLIRFATGDIVLQIER